jgi:hypothetical protein
VSVPLIPELAGTEAFDPKQPILEVSIQFR